MSAIRPLTPEDLDAFVDIVFNAYPGGRDPSKEEKERTREHLLKILDALLRAPKTRPVAR